MWEEYRDKAGRQQNSVDFCEYCKKASAQVLSAINVARPGNADKLWERVGSPVPEKPVSVQVNPEGRVVLERINSDIGVGKAEVVTRLLVWLGRQSRRIQTEVLDASGDAAAEIVRERLAQMAALPGGQTVEGLSIEECCQLIVRLTDRIRQLEAVHQQQFAGKAAGSGKKKA